MKKINIYALIVLVLGLLFILFIGNWPSYNLPLSGGAITFGLGYMLIMISIILFIVGLSLRFKPKINKKRI